MNAPDWRSVRSPHLTLDTDDVFLCDECGGLDSDGCPTCGGYRLVHGYGPGGIGYPVVVARDSRREGAEEDA